MILLTDEHYVVHSFLMQVVNELRQAFILLLVVREVVRSAHVVQVIPLGVLAMRTYQKRFITTKLERFKEMRCCQEMKTNYLRF